MTQNQGPERQESPAGAGRGERETALPQFSHPQTSSACAPPRNWLYILLTCTGSAAYIECMWTPYKERESILLACSRHTRGEITLSTTDQVNSVQWPFPWNMPPTLACHALHVHVHYVYVYVCVTDSKDVCECLILCHSHCVSFLECYESKGGQKCCVVNTSQWYGR